ncbi:hypothetical protein J2Y48_001149 [Mycoplana sp. BE70]|nr:hypothetical protein [Mycoplana sp. BE70]
MELFEADHEIKYLCVRRGPLGMILFGGAHDDVDDIGEAAAAAAALSHRVIDFCGHDQLPAILVEEFVDDVDDLFIADEVAAANQHLSCLPHAQCLEFRRLSKRGPLLSRYNKAALLAYLFVIILNLRKLIVFSSDWEETHLAQAAQIPGLCGRSLFVVAAPPVPGLGVCLDRWSSTFSGSCDLWA